MAAPSDNLFICDLPDSLDEEGVKAAFSSYGTVRQCKVLPSKVPGTCNALVRVADVEEAQWIVDNVHGNIPQGLTGPVQVRFANAPGSSKGAQKGMQMNTMMSGSMMGGGKGMMGGGMGGGQMMGGGGMAGGPMMGGGDGMNQGMIGGLGDPSSQNGMMGDGMNQQMMGGGMADNRYSPYGDSSGKGGKGDQGKGDWGKGEWGKGDGKGDGKGKGKFGSQIKALIQTMKDNGGIPAGKWENDEKTIFIANLPSDTTDTDMYTMFSAFGAIAPRGCSCNKNKETWECTGIGFVNYLDETATHNAIAMLNNCPTPDGRTLRVQVKREFADKSKGGGGGGYGGGKGGKGCYNCGGDHLARNCPLGKGGGNDWSGGKGGWGQGDSSAGKGDWGKGGDSPVEGAGL